MTEEELAQMQKMIVEAAGEIESKLATSLNKAIEGLNEKIDLNAATVADVQGKAKTAFESLPNLIQERVESQLKVNLTGIVEEVGKQFEDKVKAMAGGGNSEGARGGLNLQYLVDNSDKVIGVINAFRQPTTEQAMMGQMNFVMKWHSLLSKLEKGGGSGDEVTKAIASTFTTEKE